MLSFVECRTVERVDRVALLEGPVILEKFGEVFVHRLSHGDQVVRFFSISLALPLMMGMDWRLEPFQAFPSR
jgi:hypothetical protein